MTESAVALRTLRESVWLERSRYEQVESRYQQTLASRQPGNTGDVCLPVAGVISDSIEATMSIIQQSLSATTQTSRRADQEQRITALEKENQKLKTDLHCLVGRVVTLETRLGVTCATEPGENFDLFGGSDEEEEEVVQKIIPKKKVMKPPVVAKSTIILDVKPWDTETDMTEVERLVRGITTDGLLWGASKLVPVAYGIMKLQIACVVEDEKVGTDFLEEAITAFEDHVQSVDVVAFNKL